MSEYTDAMVEAVSEALHEEACPRSLRGAAEDCCDWTPWARAALEAVAPLIAAKALRDAADAWQTGGWSDSMPHGASRPALILGMAQRATNWLRVRADRIEGRP